MARVAVTGGTGYVAGWCIVQLLDAGHEVVATIRSPQREGELRAAIASTARTDKDLEVAVADLTADDGWDDAIAGCDFVLHVASPLSSAGDDDAIVAAAREGTVRVL